MNILELLIKLTGQKLIFPFYHSVSNTPLPHIKHLYNIKSISQFENDIQFYLKYFKPLTLNELIEVVRGNMKVTQPSFFLSFDDGLAEVYSNILPILKKYTVPAAIFLNSAFVDNKDLFYRYKASILVDAYRNDFKTELSNYCGFQMNLERFKKFVLSIQYAEKDKLDEIAELMHIDFNEYLKTNQPYLTSYQIEELKNNDFYIGAHSIDHPDFHSITDVEKVRQVEESVRFVQNKFNIDYRIFSFPFHDHNLEKNFFEEMHKKEIDLSFGTSGLKTDSVFTNLQRIPIEKSKNSARCYVQTQYVKYFIKNIIGKNFLERK
jgi:peptidoglycan/xylan/chitin deacetylase (PgdA/CDA1 family)